MTAEAAARSALAALWPGCDATLTKLHGGSEATVFRAGETPEPTVVKVWRPDQAQKAKRQVARQNAVAAAMTSHPYRAARVLHWAPEALSLVMEDAGQRTLSDEPETALHHAGRWIEAFQATSLRNAVFRPTGHINHLHRLIAQVEAGERQVYDAAGFCSAARELASTGVALQKRPAFRCITHRDLTLSNLIAAGNGDIVGIDFENDREDEPLRDLFSLAIDVAAQSLDQPMNTVFGLVSGDYGARLADDESRLFLQRVLALGYWARTPIIPSKRQGALWTVASDVLRATRPLL